MPTATSTSIRPFEASKLEINTYYIPSAIPSYVWSALRQNSIRTNVVLPLMEKALSKEQNGLLQSEDDDDLWITCSSVDAEHNRTLDLVLSCTKNEMGNYPIFIVATVPFQQLLDHKFLPPRIHNLIREMKPAGIPVERVYSIFAPEPIAQLFAEIWTSRTHIAYYAIPYYAAMLSFCTRETLIQRNATLMHGAIHFNLRPARFTDLAAVADLCYEFAAKSEPFVLDMSGAHKEAQILIQNNQVWVHEIQTEGYALPEIACIVAFTRNTQTTATITKVVTSLNHRGMKCAQRLVRQVCKHLLYSTGVQSVALYVAHDNKPAGKVYHNVGFVGLDSEYHDTQPIEGVERWTEIGFDRSRVHLGHW
ncbi:hypothetical protein FB446DRAFT_237490 [Lentinula raphanica]|nr:hypothetical protein FB446DRAFT_237490 [Lentinula raphanica]